MDQRPVSQQIVARGWNVCVTSARLTASSFSAEMVAVPERPQELSYMEMVLQRRPSRRGCHQALHILTCLFVHLPTSVLCVFVMVDTAAHYSCQLPLQWIKPWRKISSWSGQERTWCTGSCRYLGSWQECGQPLTYMWLSKDAEFILEWNSR